MKPEILPFDAALTLAKNVFKYSFTQKEPVRGVNGLMLFNNPLFNQMANILIIGNLQGLNPYNFLTYKDKNEQIIFDRKRKFDHYSYPATTIIRALDSPEHPYHLEKTLDTIMPYLYDNDGNEMISFDGRRETITLPETGLIDLTNLRNMQEVREKITERLNEKTVLGHTQKQIGRDNSIDLLVKTYTMEPRFLEDTSLTHIRSMLIQQCEDSQFWPKMFRTGMLYDQFEGKFNIPFRNMYPNAIKLFEEIEVN